MKKIIFTVIVFIMMFICAAVAFSESPSEVEIVEVKSLASIGKIYVVAKIVNPQKKQEITVLVYEKGKTLAATDDFYYIDQLIPALSNNGEFTLSLSLKASVEFDKTYVLRMGGIDINKVDKYEFVFTDNFKLGDVNGDSEIDLQDVVAFLRYDVGLKTSFSRLNADVNGDQLIDNRDATYLLRALAGYSQEKEIIFP